VRPILPGVRRAADALTLRVVLSLTRGTLRLLHATGHGYVFESLRRKQWFYRARHPVFVERHMLGTVAPVEPSDVGIASRLIAAWARAARQADGPPTPGIWAESYQETSPLLKALEKQDPEQLATLLAGMFHSRFIQGMAHGFRHREWPSSRLLVPMTIEDRLVSLAEALGVVRAETSEQGEVAAAAREGLEPVVRRVERSLGYSLGFPEVGAPSGIRVGGRLLTMRSMDHIYTASRIARARPRIDGGGPIDALEIGGGYGGLCYWMVQQFKQSLRRYVVVDLPWVNVVQGYFLARALGADTVSFYGEPARRIMVLPAASREWRELRPLSLIINQDSLPEMPESVAGEYLRWIAGRSGACFFSFQQESANVFKGVPQNVVHELASAEPSLRLLSRDLSWTRDGYTEELYAVA
jgi:hypothetical protein